MKTWSLSSGGVLNVSDETNSLRATVDQVYASIVELTPQWEDMPTGKHGAASKLEFSAYPVDATLVIHDSDDARPSISLEARTQLDQSFPLAPEAFCHGHVVHEGIWYPVSTADTHSITILLRELGLDLNVPALTTLHQCLRLRRAAANGEPVLDRLSDDTLLGLSTIDNAALPHGINAKLYTYQVRGWRWLRFIISEKAGCILADEMGLGKTLQVISAIRDHGAITSTTGSLVVAPGSLLENWVREIEKFCPGLDAVKHHGPDRTGSPAALRTAAVVITSYETAVRDLALLRMTRWHVVVLDEAQNIRNPDTRRAQAVKNLRREVSVAVTGTPVENRLRDLWSIMDFVLPGYLGDLPSFEARYSDNDNDASSLEPLVSPVILRRRVQEVAQDLPPRIDIPEILELDDDEAIAYEDVRVAIHREYGATATLVALTKLRQFCAHPALIEAQPLSHSYSKFARLIAILGEVFARREKALVFTSYTAMADRIAMMVQDEFGVISGTIDGRLPIPERQPLIDQFTVYQAPAVLVLNPRAGGMGLNIAAANHVIQYNPEWNPAIEDQAAARAHRRGQKRPVTIRRLIVANTVEEVIDKRLQRKRVVAGNAVVGIQGEKEEYRDVMAALTRSPVTNIK